MVSKTVLNSPSGVAPERRRVCFVLRLTCVFRPTIISDGLMSCVSPQPLTCRFLRQATCPSIGLRRIRLSRSAPCYVLVRSNRFVYYNILFISAIKRGIFTDSKKFFLAAKPMFYGEHRTCCFSYEEIPCPSHIYSLYR